MLQKEFFLFTTSSSKLETNPSETGGMEKTNSRNSIKATNSDPKVKQDVANKHLRLPRVKESVSPRPDTRRKPNPQKNRELFDKRPRNRTGNLCERYRNEVTDDYVDEIFNKQGSKKVSLNHLLNFHLAPLETRDVGTRRAAFNRNKHPKYNKELFLQANCQFIARSDGNYSVHEKNPDILVEWPFIEEIRLPSYEVPSCPICLYSPIAAKITRCGHIYCWPCILHYLALTDRTWQKCPICFEAVHKTELKSVSLQIRKSFNVGDEISMCLMKRVKGSLFSTPVVCESPKKLCSVNTDDDVARFQKLLLADKKDIYSIIERERSELKEVYLKEKDTPEACFIESALKLLEERETNINSKPEITPGEDKLSPDSEACNNTYQRSHHESISSTDSHEEIFAFDLADQNGDSQMSECTTKCLQTSATCDMSPDSEKKGISYFYQAEDGQHIYLHNINVRMLIKEYGSLENSFPVIKANIVAIESVSMTENLRKRLRYLQHLPLTCEFQVVELDFSQILDKSTLLLFESEIKKRKQFRNRKARDERRREKFIEIEENKKLGRYPKATYNLQSIDQFPSCHPDDFQPLSPPKHGNGLGNLHASDNASPQSQSDGTNLSPVCSASPGNEDVPTTSFAQMLKDGPKNFTGTPKEKKKELVESPSHIDSLVDLDGENFLPPPEYHHSIGDAIQAALDSVSLNDAGNGQKSSKKKKGKKQLLFTTSMCRKN